MLRAAYVAKNYFLYIKEILNFLHYKQGIIYRELIVDDNQRPI